MPLSRPATLLSRLLPSSDRDAIVGDLLEDAADRDLTGPGLTVWLCAECGQIAAGLAIDRVRLLCVPPMRDVACAVASESARPFRHARGGPVNALLSVFLVCASAVLMAVSAMVLVSVLFSASYR